MKHLRAVLPRLLTLLILSLTLIFNLASCDMPVPPEYTASHLDKYFVPDFDKSKLQAVERGKTFSTENTVRAVQDMLCNLGKL